MDWLLFLWQREAFSQILEEIDCALLEHIKDLNGLEDTVPIERYFSCIYLNYCVQFYMHTDGFANVMPKTSQNLV